GAAGTSQRSDRRSVQGHWAGAAVLLCGPSLSDPPGGARRWCVAGLLGEPDGHRAPPAAGHLWLQSARGLPALDRRGGDVVSAVSLVWPEETGGAGVVVVVSVGSGQVGKSASWQVGELASGEGGKGNSEQETGCPSLQLLIPDARLLTPDFV